MTGDLPPTPFLTKQLPEIGERFVRKGWLSMAFGAIRADERQSGRLFAGDLLVPPDIHGEYVPRRVYFAEGSTWGATLRVALLADRVSGSRPGRFLGRVQRAGKRSAFQHQRRRHDSLPAGREPGRGQRARECCCRGWLAADVWYAYSGSPAPRAGVDRRRAPMAYD